MTRTLKIAAELSLPLNAVTQKLAFLGRTGSGKTYAASALAEKMYEESAQFVALDSVGIWYGLRLAADGKSPGIAIPVFGGLHGDIPLEATGGKMIADLIVDRGISAIVDVSQFEYDTDKARFAGDFAARLFYRKKSAPSAMHVFLEECQEFVPQNPQKGEERMLHAFNRMVRQGRNFGIGTSMISQRPQDVNKKALNQAECVFAFQITGPHERKAVDGWISEKGLDTDIAADLPKLAAGHAHVWSPGWLRISKEVHIGRKWTFNASATPEVGQRVKARNLAPIELEQLRTDMAATIERAKADDPRELRKRIAELELQVKALPTKATSAAVSERWDKVVKGLQARLAEKEAGEKEMSRQIAAMTTIARSILGDMKSIRESMEVAEVSSMGALKKASIETDVRKANPLLPSEVWPGWRGKGPGAHPSEIPTDVRKEAPFALPDLEPRLAVPAPAFWVDERPPQKTKTNGEQVHTYQQPILDALARFEALGQKEVGRRHAAALAGKSPRSSAFAEALAKMRAAGLIEYGSGGTLILTDGGRAGANPVSRPASSEELINAYKTHILDDYERRLFEVLVNVSGRAIDREDLSAKSGLSMKSSAFAEALASMRKLGIVEYTSDKKVRVAPSVFLEGS